MKNNLALRIEDMNLDTKQKSAKVMRKIVELQNKRYEESNGNTAYRVVPRYDVYGVGWSWQ